MTEVDAVSLEPIIEKRDKGLEAFETVHEEVTSVDATQPKIEEVPENVELIPSSGDDIIVFARTPLEMARSQNALVAWVKRRVAKAQGDLGNAEANLEMAKEAKIRTAGWKAEVRKYEKELRFYTKVQAALEDGYFIVPDFPMNILAVRTRREYATDTNEYQHRGSIDNETHQELEVGAGEYVDAQPLPRKYEVPKEKDGKIVLDDKNMPVMVTRWTADGVPLRKMDFPFRMIKPHLLKDLKKAADKRIFDAIGVVPGPQHRNRDPMLLGIIENKLGKYRSQKMVFLISWWVPTADL